MIPPLVAVPVLLALRHRYNKRGALRKSHRWLGIVFIYCSLLAVALYLPAHPLILVSFSVLLSLALLNSQFYIFLAGKRGLAFMLAAIPFHLLYHFYNGISFLIGVVRHVWRKMIAGGVRPIESPAHLEPIVKRR
jgi:hypothetical protein